MEKEESLLRILTPTLRQFLAAEFFCRFSEMGSMFMPLYLVTLGASPVDIGLLITVSGIVSLAMSLVGGWVSDTRGRLRAILLGSGAGAISLAVAILARRWEWLFLSYALGNIGWALTGPSYSAFIAEETPEEHRAKVYAVRQNLRSLLGIVGAPTAGLLVNLYGFRVMLAAGLGVLLVGVLMVAGLARQERKIKVEGGEGKSSKWESLPSSLRVLGGLLLAGGLFSWLFAIDSLNDVFLQLSQPFSILLFEDVIGVSVGKISLLPAIGGVIGLVVTIPIGYWVDKKGEHVGLGGAYFLLAFLFGVPLVVRNYAGVLATALFHPVAHALGGPAYNSLVSKAVPEERRGIAFGLTTTSKAFIAMPIPLLGGFLWERFSPDTPFWVTVAGCFVLSALAFWKLRAPKVGEGESEQGG